MKTLDNFIEPERRIKLTFKGEMRRLFGELKSSPSRERLDSDIVFEPDLVDCRALCSQENIDICRKHGVHICRDRHQKSNRLRPERSGGRRR